MAATTLHKGIAAMGRSYKSIKEPEAARPF